MRATATPLKIQTNVFTKAEILNETAKGKSVIFFCNSKGHMI